jgi:anti-anti-sigma factor
MSLHPSSTTVPDDPALPADLRVEVSFPTPDTVVLTAIGEVDVSSEPTLRHAVGAILAPGRRDVVIDLDRLSFMDVSVLNALVDARKRLSAHDSTLRVRCRGRLGRLMLTVVGLGSLLT